jgi:photosystem II stability/assembly factor-like uncharacterized protein
MADRTPRHIRERKRAVQPGLIAIAILLVVGTGSETIWAGTNVWTSIGPYGGSGRALAMDPRNPSTVYAGTSGGVFKTTNGGASWKAANSGLTAGYIARAIIIDPQNPSILYAGGACGVYGPCGIFKSTDGAVSWRAINSGLDGSVIVVESLAIDPQDPRTLYAGTSACFQPSGIPGFVEGGENLCYRPGVFKTTDGGATWNSMNVGLPWASVDFGFVAALAVDSQTPDTIYASIPGGVFKSINGGMSWEISLMRHGAAALAIDPQNPSTLYTADWSGVLKSTNGGASWIAMNSGLPENCCGALAIDPQNPLTIYAGGRYDLSYADGRYGIFVSTDGGVTWANTGMPWTNNLPTFAPDPANPSVGLAVDPQNAGTVYLASGNVGLFKSTDRGGTWNPANSGLSATEVHSTALDPHSPGTIYAATTAGLFKTNDGGANWSAANDGLPTGRGSYPISLVTDSQKSGRVYADILPTSWEGNMGLNGGIFKTTDGGDSWSATGLAPEGGYFYGPLVIDSQNPSTLYAGGVPPKMFGSLFESTDGGTNWTANASFPYHGNGISALAIDPQNPNALYVAASFEVLKSTDAGASWSYLPVPLDSLGDCDECLAVSHLAVDPQKSNTIYAGGSVGILKSDDGGASWTAANHGLPWSPGQYDVLTALVIDPHDSNTLYVAFAGRVFRSTDGAANWSDISSGLTVTSVSTLALDPNDENTLYAGTYGGGIFAITIVP